MGGHGFSRVIVAGVVLAASANQLGQQSQDPRALPPSLQGFGKGRPCPAWPKSAAACPIRNVTAPVTAANIEFEPVCVLHFPQIGGELAEQQQRRCMPGEKMPYYQDSEGVFRCACCGAPL